MAVQTTTLTTDVVIKIKQVAEVIYQLTERDIGKLTLSLEEFYTHLIERENKTEDKNHAGESIYTWRAHVNAEDILDYRYPQLKHIHWYLTYSMKQDTLTVEFSHSSIHDNFKYTYQDSVIIEDFNKLNDLTLSAHYRKHLNLLVLAVMNMRPLNPKQERIKGVRKNTLMVLGYLQKRGFNVVRHETFFDGLVERITSERDNAMYQVITDVTHRCMVNVGMFTLDESFIKRLNEFGEEQLEEKSYTIYNISSPTMFHVDPFFFIDTGDISASTILGDNLYTVSQNYPTLSPLSNLNIDVPFIAIVQKTKENAYRAWFTKITLEIKERGCLIATDFNTVIAEDLDMLYKHIYDALINHYKQHTPFTRLYSQLRYNGYSNGLVSFPANSQGERAFAYTLTVHTPSNTAVKSTITSSIIEDSIVTGFKVTGGGEKECTSGTDIVHLVVSEDDKQNGLQLRFYYPAWDLYFTENGKLNPRLSMRSKSYLTPYDDVDKVKRIIDSVVSTLREHFYQSVITLKNINIR